MLLSDQVCCRTKEQVTEEENSFSNLPHDIFREILIRVSTETLVTLKCVCKRWNKTISDPWFVKLHLNRSRSLPPGLIKHDGIATYYYYCNDITGERFNVLHDMFNDDILIVEDSCDGLLFMGAFDTEHNPNPNPNPVGYDCPDSYHIANPVTRFSTKIPSPPEKNYEYFRLVFDDTIQQYKILAWYARAEEDYEDVNGVDPSSIPFCNTLYKVPHFHKLLVLTLGGTCIKNASWRKLTLPKRYRVGCEPVVFDRKVYWVSYLKSAKRHLIISMDIASEKMEEIEMPNLSKFDRNLILCLKLMVVRGSLYLVFGSLDHHCCIIWILEDIEKQIWTKLHQKKYEMNHDTCACSSDSNYIMVPDGRDSSLSELESQARSVLHLYNQEAVTHVAHFNSLVSLKVKS